ncbi:hypothetical protein CHISP_0237 [Chitinispirillum alkaliphilum]|nr:hypothetical protein CHISP_0237 [Chitinispirillum alkaliphilum]
MLRKEFKSFAGSDRGVFAVYAILIVVWSFLLASGDSSLSGGPFLFIFFSAIITANFSNTVFISERMNGSLEILITSGLSRNSVLFGKLLFTVVMTTLIGLACAALSLLWSTLLIDYHFLSFRFSDLLLYTSATVLNAAGSAYFSVRLSSPRLLHFVNLFILGIIITLYSIISYFYSPGVWLLLLLLLLPALWFVLLAQKQFAGERIIQPVIL